MEWLSGMLAEALIARGVETSVEQELADLKEWFAGVKAEQREADAVIAESDHLPRGFGLNALSMGSRSQWYANGRDQAAAAIRAAGIEAGVQNVD